jgi:hypothetical protein
MPPEAPRELENCSNINLSSTIEYSSGLIDNPREGGHGAKFLWSLVQMAQAVRDLSSRLIFAVNIKMPPVCFIQTNSTTNRSCNTLADRFETEPCNVVSFTGLLISTCCQSE